MRKISRVATILLASSALWLAGASTAQAERTRCYLDYEVTGWAVVYQTLRGTGTVECADGQAAKVKIVTHGAGFSLGTFDAIKGRGRFSGVETIDRLFGTFVEANAHAGAGGAVAARGMFKGNVRLGLTGNGEGFNVGFAFGAFKIERE